MLLDGGGGAVGRRERARARKETRGRGWRVTGLTFGSECEARATRREPANSSQMAQSRESTTAQLEAHKGVQRGSSNEFNHKKSDLPRQPGAKLAPLLGSTHVARPRPGSSTARSLRPLDSTTDDDDDEALPGLGALLSVTPASLSRAKRKGTKSDASVSLSASFHSRPPKKMASWTPSRSTSLEPSHGSISTSTDASRKSREGETRCRSVSMGRGDATRTEHDRGTLAFYSERKNTSSCCRQEREVGEADQHSPLL